jgi:hypothetical protein
MTNKLYLTRLRRRNRGALGLALLLGVCLSSVAFIVTRGSTTEGLLPRVPSSHEGSPGLLSESPVDSGKKAVSAQLEGSLDKVEVASLGGWAWDASQPNTAIKVEIYDGTTLLSTITAQEFREDLKTAGKGDGKHAFNYAFPRTLRDGQLHTISVRYAGTFSELPGSPKTLLFPKS